MKNTRADQMPEWKRNKKSIFLSGWNVLNAREGSPAERFPPFLTQLS